MASEIAPRLSEPESDEREWMPLEYADECDNTIAVVHAVDPSALRDAIEALKRVATLIVNEQRFSEHARKRKAETKFLSNVTAKCIHPEYQKIIGMGEAAVPLSLDDLARNGPADWFWALTMITDENPITEDIAGNMKAMTEAWLQWGNKIGYLKDSHQKTKSASS